MKLQNVDNSDFDFKLGIGSRTALIYIFVHSKVEQDSFLYKKETAGMANSAMLPVVRQLTSGTLEPQKVFLIDFFCFSKDVQTLSLTCHAIENLYDV